MALCSLRALRLAVEIPRIERCADAAEPGDSLTEAAGLIRINFKADVAQLVEQSIRNRQVIGSSPIVGSRFLAINDLQTRKRALRCPFAFVS
jgi:hypothetical protein